MKNADKAIHKITQQEEENMKKLHEGKTKRVRLFEDDKNMVVIENKPDITKNDDPSQTKVMSGKAELATTTTCAVFQLLKDAGIPVAFERQLSPTEFLSPWVKMIPLEIIWRRYAVGSFLNRHPELIVPQGVPPHRFHRAVFELFLKTTNGVIKDRDGTKIGHLPKDIVTKKPVDDPFISNPDHTIWKLYHPKKPSWDESADLDHSILWQKCIPSGIDVETIENLLRRVGLVLEGAWSQLGCRLIDFKIEMGVTKDGKLVVADVIDADSWRLRDSDWNELSKQLFRDNVDLDLVADKYALVAKMVSQLRIPKQAIVFWRGSVNDPLPEDLTRVAGIKGVEIVLSGHKSPEKCIRKLEELLTAHPEGGVILACVGMSNGLGPILSARTSWPVIGVAMSGNSFPDDIWSNVRMPREVPMNTILSIKNAFLAALNILAQKNPAAYAERQLAIEDLEK